MEDKNIIINDKKYRFFNFYNEDQPLTQLRYFNSDRLIFTKPVIFKIPNNNMLTFNRVFVAISGPKTRTVNEELKNVYDVNELIDYDKSLDYKKTQLKSEFLDKYDFFKLEDTNYYVLVDYEWYKTNIDPNLQEPRIIYNINDKLYHDDKAQRDFIMEKFTVFNATKMFRNKKALLMNKIPPEHYHIMLTKKWVKENLSEKYLSVMNNEYNPLVFPSEEVFTFGISQNMLDTSGVSYQISLCLYDRAKPKDSEIKWAAKYEELATVCREYLKETEFKRLKGQIDTMKGLSWKRNNIGDEDGPKLYPKIIYNQTKKMFITAFVDKNGDDIEDTNLVLDKRGKVKVALRLESIFIGSKVALQVKVNDVLILNWLEAFKIKALIVRAQNNNKRDKTPESDKERFSTSEEEDEEEKPVKRVVKTVKM